MTAQMDHTTEEMQRAVKGRLVAEVATLDYRRAIKHLEHEMRQVDIARALRVSQPALSSALKTARKVSDAAPGFSGAGPYEICQRYAVGEIDREQLLDELVRWYYPPRPRPEWLEDSVGPEPAGSWAEMERALWDGLVDDATYDEVLDRTGPTSA